MNTELHPILILAWALAGGSPFFFIAILFPLTALYFALVSFPLFGFLPCLPLVPLLFIAAAFGWREIFFGGIEGHL